MTDVTLANLHTATPAQAQAFTMMVAEALHGNLDGWEPEEARIITDFLTDICECASYELEK